MASGGGDIPLPQKGEGKAFLVARDRKSGGNKMGMKADRRKDVCLASISEPEQEITSRVWLWHRTEIMLRCTKAERVKHNPLSHLFFAVSLGSRMEPENLVFPHASSGSTEGSRALRSRGLPRVTMGRGKMICS